MRELPGASCIVRIEFLHARIGCDRLAETVQLIQSKALVGEHLDQIRTKGERALEPRESFLGSIEPKQGIADIVADNGIVGRLRMEAQVVLQAFVVSLQGTQRTCAIEQGRGVVALPRLAQVETGQRFLEALELVQQHAAPIRRLEVMWVELKHLLIDDQRIGRTAESRERAGELF